MPYPFNTSRSSRFPFDGSSKIFFVVAMLLALSLPASAQQTVSDSLKITCWNSQSPCAGSEEGPIHKAIAAAVALEMQSPTSGVEREDGRFQVVLGAFITAAGTDIATTMYHMGTGTVREAGVGAWWQDSPVAFAVTKSAVTALFAYQLQKLHKTRPKTAIVLGVVSAGIEASLVARTARLGSHAP